MVIQIIRLRGCLTALAMLLVASGVIAEDRCEAFVKYGIYDTRSNLSNM